MSAPVALFSILELVAGLLSDRVDYWNLLCVLRISSSILSDSKMSTTSHQLIISTTYSLIFSVMFTILLVEEPRGLRYRI